jgi:hypothetical protein
MLTSSSDYTHGRLTTFLHAMPILRRGPASNLRANCLLNTDSLRTVEDYLSDYNQIPDITTLDALAQILILVRQNEELPCPLADYTFYTWSKPGPYTFYVLLPRKEFTKWFYSLFFRLALLMKIDLAMEMKIVFTPHHLCVLFRLITQLRGFGYPSHWLSEPLLNLTNNTVIATARPPRTKSMRPADVKREYPEKKLCLRHSHTSPLLLARFSSLYFPSSSAYPQFQMPPKPTNTVSSFPDTRTSRLNRVA